MPQRKVDPSRLPLPRFEVKHGRRGFYWRLRACNGKIVGIGGEPFATRSSAVRAARNVRSLILDVPNWVAAV